MIGSGGFSLIYLAEDEDTRERVVIKEYLPKKMAARRKVAKIEVAGGEKQQNTFHHGRKLFYQEAKALAGLQHPNVVKVRNFFLANGTSYLVMDYEPGKNLGRYIKQRRGSLSATFLMNVFPPILDALSLIHSSRHLHLDIKPSNIHLRPGGSPLLLDFGAVHDVSRVSQSKSGRVVTPGFSPVEQYYASGHIGPWSDVYAIGASMRACIEGKSPPSAIKRHAKDNMSVAASSFAGRYPAYLLQAMDWAMEMDPRRRPQTAGDMLRVLMEQIEQPVAATTKTNATEQWRAEDS
ncbi:Serine/threonine protein kinase [hydrothermal vent metagenome]|uniref:Serine/threonine protein kinase n=1 Tax=hydrothermal vent metagenome TaxID=652676 RepID=A0A3B1BA85_9ZZZZ